MRLLASQTVEAEVVIRDPRSTPWQALGGMTVVFVFLFFRVWVGPIGLSRLAVAGAAAVAVVGVGATLFRLPVWVCVGSEGVAYRSWWRSGRFRWAEIASFELGNPSEPRFAYVILQASPGGRGHPVKLPAFSTMPPVELVRKLRAKQAVFAGEG